MNLFEEWNASSTSATASSGVDLEPSFQFKPEPKSLPSAGGRNAALGPNGAETLPPFHNSTNPIFHLQQYDVAPTSSTSALPAAFASRRGLKRQRPPPLPLTWSILAAAVADGVLLLGTSDSRVLRWSLDGGQDTIEVSRRREESIHKVFLDPTGSHGLICLHSGDTCYLHHSSVKPRKLSKWSGVVVESVAFDRKLSSESSTKSMLVGSRDGCIYEASLDSSGKEKVFTKVYQLEQSGPVYSLHFEALPSEPQILVMAATANPTRLYTLLGGPTLEALFRSYREPGNTSFQELPGHLMTTELRLLYNAVGGSSHNSQPEAFAMLTSLGVYHGSLALSSNSKTGISASNLVVDAKLQPYPSDPVSLPSSLDKGSLAGPGPRPSGVAGSELVPLSLAITPYHFLLLYPNKLEATSRLSGGVVQEIALDTQHGHALMLLCDAADNGLWLVTDRTTFHVMVADEDRHVWRICLERGLAGDEQQFDRALGHCREESERHQVYYLRGGWHISRGEYELAAGCYAAVPLCFVEIVLKFITAGGADPVVAGSGALEHYLLGKLERLGSDPNHQKTLRTMLSTWLIQLYLAALVRDNSSNNSSSSSDRVVTGSTAPGASAALSSASDATAVKLRHFLRSNSAHLHPGTTFSMLAAHGRHEEMLAYAEAIEDFDRIVTYHTTRGKVDARQALAVLINAPFDKVESLVYRDSAILMEEDPQATIAAWTDMPRLKPTKLIPALVRYSKKRQMSASSRREMGPDLAKAYLEHCVRVLHHTEPAIHNHYLTLCAQEAQRNRDRAEEAFEALYQLLKAPKEQRYFDLKYALRVCSQLGLTQACIYIYGAMELFEEAVQLALTRDLELAKENANKPLDPEVRKRLWLKIAEHTVKAAGSDTAAAISILSECSLLKIEDILPFFPDFVVIDSFKTEICQSLEEYNTKIQALRAEMEEYTKAAESTLEEINELQSRKLYVSSKQSCELCGSNIMLERFYLFPCGHAFHARCLGDHMIPHLSPEQADQVVALMAELEEANSGGWVGNSKRKELLRKASQAELDGYIAAECALCGDLMIEVIDMPLVSEEEAEAEAEAWALT
ncbi:unnamed protein product [Chrysoparadoxa australica]